MKRIAAVIFLLFSISVTAAVTTSTHSSYALRPCSTCKEIVYPTKAECEAAALAEAQRVGLTRTTGAAVYTCITRYNVLATFRPNPPPPPAREAFLRWDHDGLNLEGFRVVYGASPTAMTQAVMVPVATARTYLLTNLAPGTYYFSVYAYGGGNDSLPSNVISKTIQ